MGCLSRTFTPELVDFVVDEAGAWEERTKSLPASLMVNFVLTMWLFTGYGYGLASIVQQPDFGGRLGWLPGLSSAVRGRVVA